MNGGGGGGRTRGVGGEEERRDTSSTLGQAQSIEVCFGRTKLTLCQHALLDPAASYHRYHRHHHRHHQISSLSLFLSPSFYPPKQRCLLFEWGGRRGWRRWTGGVECDRVPPPRASPVESAASTETLLSACLSLPPPLPLLSLTLHLHSTRSTSISPSLHPLPRLALPTPAAAAASCSVGWLAGGCGGTAGVWWWRGQKSI